MSATFGKFFVLVFPWGQSDNIQCVFWLFPSLHCHSKSGSLLQNCPMYLIYLCVVKNDRMVFESHMNSVLTLYDMFWKLCSKTLLKLAMARIKLLRNKRDIQIKQLRKDIAQLLTTGQEPSARIRVS